MQGIAISICGLRNFTRIIGILMKILGMIKKVMRWMCSWVYYFFCTILPWPLLQVHKYVVIPIWEMLCAVNGLTFNMKEMCVALCDRCYRRYHPYDALEAV